MIAFQPVNYWKAAKNSPSANNNMSSDDHRFFPDKGGFPSNIITADERIASFR